MSADVCRGDFHIAQHVSHNTLAQVDMLEVRAELKSACDLTACLPFVFDISWRADITDGC